MARNLMGSEPWTYFGLWSARDVREVSNLLTLLEVQFTVDAFTTTDEVLKEWFAWDTATTDPNIGFDLWINSADLPAVGDKIVAMFPERTFKAP
jgi:hypothetical protein